MSEIKLSEIIPSNVQAGVVINDNGVLKIQPLKFNGDDPIDAGEPTQISTFYTFDTGREVPVYTSGNMQIYKCAEVKSPGSILIVSNANNGPGYNGTYVLDSGTGNSRFWRNQDDSNKVVMYKESYGKWCIGTLPEGYTDSAYLSAHHVAYATEPTDPWDCSYTGGADIDPITDAWSGYLYNTETKTFADTLTEELTYKMVAPVVGNVYNADATMRIDLYTPSGLVFYAPLHEQKATDETWHNLSFDDSVSVETVKGIQAVSFSGSQGVTCNLGFKFDTSFTVSIMLYQTDTTERRAFYVDDGQGSEHGALTLQQWGSSLDIGYGGSSWVVNDPTVTVANSWMILALVCDRQTGTSQAYKDGVLIGNKQFVASTTLLDAIYLGRSRTGSERFSGCLAEVKVWNRALSAEEINEETERCLAMIKFDTDSSSSATPDVNQPYGTKLSVNYGDTLPSFLGGTYIINDPTAQGTDRIWSLEGNSVYTIQYKYESWYACESGLELRQVSDGSNPWESVATGITVTVIE